MNSAIPGIVLIVLALLVAGTFTVDLVLSRRTEDTITRLPDDDLVEEAAPAAVVISIANGEEDEREGALRAAADERFKDNRGFLTSLEREQIDAEGYLIYEVQRNDTLSGLSQRYLGKSSLWTLIQEHNPRTLADPTTVRPGTKIRIPLWLRE